MGNNVPVKRGKNVPIKWGLKCPNNRVKMSQQQGVKNVAIKRGKMSHQKGVKKSPDKSVLIGQKLVKTAKIEKFKYDILSVFQTIWYRCTAPLVLTK